LADRGVNASQTSLAVGARIELNPEVGERVEIVA
jgi:hypothetical protein